MRLDHVILGVGSLTEAADRLYRHAGLASVDGGRHPAWGTANRIVPLGRDYVELLSVVDGQAAARTNLGRHLAAHVAGGDRLFRWCVATPDLDSVAARLGLPPVAGSRALPDGLTVRWRTVGLDAALDEPCLPFFIDWGVPEDLHPGRATAPHRVRPRGLSWVRVSGDPARIDAWLGGAALPVRVVPGPPALVAAGVETEVEEVELR